MSNVPCGAGIPAQTYSVTGCIFSSLFPPCIRSRRQQALCSARRIIVGVHQIGKKKCVSHIREGNHRPHRLIIPINTQIDVYSIRRRHAISLIEDVDENMEQAETSPHFSDVRTQGNSRKLKKKKIYIKKRRVRHNFNGILLNADNE